MYMLDSDQEPSYNYSKNHLLLPRILKLIEDMVDDSTPLYLVVTSLQSGSGYLYDGFIQALTGSCQLAKGSRGRMEEHVNKRGGD